MTYAPGNIFFVGDSITTDGYCIYGGYPVYTIDYLNARDSGGWAESIKRAGHGGANTWNGASYITQDIQNVTLNMPDYIFIYYGANDAFDYANPDHYPFDSHVETSWKTAAAFIIEALHTAFPNAVMWWGKSYRCNAVGDVEPWMPNFLFPWIDDMVATYSYLNVGIRGDEVLTAGWPESMGGSGVHPACYGNELLATAIMNEMFPSGKKILLKR